MQLKFSRNKVKLFRKKTIMSELFSESECVDTSLKADKLILSNTAIGLYSSNNNKNTIICEINLKRTTSDGPLKLVLKDDGSCRGGLRHAFSQRQSERIARVELECPTACSCRELLLPRGLAGKAERAASP